MIHVYASIWRCLMHDIFIGIREKACVHVHHLERSTQEWKWKQLSAIIQVKRGSEKNGMKRSQIKWKHLLFDESDFFFF